MLRCALGVRVAPGARCSADRRAHLGASSSSSIVSEDAALFLSRFVFFTEGARTVEDEAPHGEETDACSSEYVLGRDLSIRCRRG